MAFKRLLGIKGIFIFMVAWAFILGILPANATAMPVSGSQSLRYISASRQQDIELILKLFENEIAAKKFLRMGVNREFLRQRLEKLDDIQLHSLAIKACKIRVAGDLGTTVLIIFIVILVIVAILYVTDYSIKVEPKH